MRKYECICCGLIWGYYRDDEPENIICPSCDTPVPVLREKTEMTLMEEFDKQKYRAIHESMTCYRDQAWGWIRSTISGLDTELQKQTERAEKAKAEMDNLIYENKVRDKAIDLLQKGMVPNQGGYLMLEARIALEAQARAELAEHDRSHKPTPEDIRNLTDVLKKDGNDG